MNRLPVVGMDIDDVLADFISEFMQYASKYGVNPSLRPTSWDWDGIGITGDELQRVRDIVWKDVIATNDFHLRLKAVPGASVGLIQELDKRTNLYFPTARFESAGRSARKQTALWLNWKFGLENPTVIVSSEKGEMARVLKYDYFIDDRPKNCIEVKEALPSCQVFLCDSTHNQNFHDARYPRVQNADEFAHIVLTSGSVN